MTKRKQALFLKLGVNDADRQDEVVAVANATAETTSRGIAVPWKLGSWAPGLPTGDDDS